ARVHRLWASLTADPTEQTRHFERSASYYAEAVRRGPHDPALWKEWATLYLEWHQPAKALAKLDQSLRLSDDADTSSLRAKTLLEVEVLGAPAGSRQAASPGSAGERPEGTQQDTQ